MRPTAANRLFTLHISRRGIVFLEATVARSTGLAVVADHLEDF